MVLFNKEKAPKFHIVAHPFSLLPLLTNWSNFLNSASRISSSQIFQVFFKHNRYPTTSDLKYLSTVTSMSSKQIADWFINERYKLRKQSDKADTPRFWQISNSKYKWKKCPYVCRPFSQIMPHLILCFEEENAIISAKARAAAARIALWKIKHLATSSHPKLLLIKIHVLKQSFNSSMYFNNI